MKKIIRNYFYKENAEISDKDIIFWIIFILIFYIAPIILIGYGIIQGARGEEIIDCYLKPVEKTIDLLIKLLNSVITYLLYSAFAIGLLIAIIILFALFYEIIKTYIKRTPG